MAASRKYQITWPLTAESATQIDEMFDELYRQAADTANEAAITTLVLAAETKGSLLYVSDTDGTIDGLPAVATGNALISQGTLTAPIYGKITLTGHVSGILPVANGGTGVATLTGILQGNGASAVTAIANSSTVGQILRVTGAATYAWGALDLADTDAVTGILPAVNGGTGIALYAVGDLLYADTTTTLAKLADVATGNAVISGGVGVAPVWGKIALTTHVSGVLPIANGGTNSSAALSGTTLMISDGTKIVQGTAGTTVTVLHGNAAGSPTYGAVVLTTDVSGILPLANGGSGANLSATGGAGQFVKQNSAGGIFTVGTAASTVLSDTANIAYLNAANSFSVGPQTTLSDGSGYGIRIRGRSSDSQSLLAFFDTTNVTRYAFFAAASTGGGQLQLFATAGASFTLSSTFDVSGNTGITGTLNVSSTSLLTGTVTLGGSALLTFGANSYIKAGSVTGFVVDNSADTRALLECQDTGLINFWCAQTTVQASVSTAGLITCKNLTDSALTSTRVVFAGAGGALTDDADMTFATDTLTVTKIVATTSVNITGSLQCDSIVNDTGLAHGTYTPTATATNNLASNPTAQPAQYLRVGNTVTVSGQVTAVDPTLAATNTNFKLTLPIASSLSNNYELAGVAFCGNIAGMGAEITARTADDTAAVTWISSDITSQSWSYTYTYQII